MNQKKTYIGITVFVLVFGFIFLPKIFKRIANDDVTRGGRMNIIGGTAQSESPDGELSYIPFNGKDRKAPAFKFVNQVNDTISNADYKGKVYLVEFFFSRCINICIPMNHNLQMISEQFKDNPSFGIASFTMDPGYDTPEVLKAYADSYGVTNKNWHFLTGANTDLLKLANEGFNIPAGKNEDSDNFGLYHSGLFALVDQNGFIRSRKDDFGNPLIYYRGFIAADAEVQAGDEQPQIDILIEDIKTLLE